ncbi:MAG: BRCT domain-containing protein [Desulforhopalus sp.]
MLEQPLDANGQPRNRLYNQKRLNDRTIDELLGIVKGITADGKVNILEAKFIASWMEQNAKHSDNNTINLLYSRIKEMVVDNILDQDEQQELLELLKSITGEQHLADTAVSTPATFPLNTPPPVIDASGAVFCMTGTFAYGPRKVCAEAIVERGGIVKNRVTQDTDYLVIGNLCSPEWIHTSYGRKIEKALQLQKEQPFANIKIIHEDHWARHIFSESLVPAKMSNKNQTPGLKTRPERRKRLSVPGMVVKLSEVTDLEPDGTLTQHYEEVSQNFLKKGWCIFKRSGYIGLAGYAAETKEPIPFKDRTATVQYEDFTNNRGEQKTRVYTPRNVHIISIAYIRIVDKHGQFTTNNWEVKTHWTVKRNLFAEFKPAWELFLSIEQRYDPGTILWTKLDDYDAFEKY